jgi:hypothetical protein
MIEATSATASAPMMCPEIGSSSRYPPKSHQHHDHAEMSASPGAMSSRFASCDEQTARQIVEQLGANRAFKPTGNRSFSRVAEHNEISLYRVCVVDDLSLRITLADAGNDIHALSVKIVNRSVQRLLKGLYPQQAP